MKFLQIDNPIVDSLEDLHRSMESSEIDTDKLLGLAQTISTEGMSVNIYNRVNSINPDALSSINARAFTVARSSVKAQASCEGIMTVTINVLAALLRKLIEMLNNALEWLIARNPESKDYAKKLDKACKSYGVVNKQYLDVKAKAETKRSGGTLNESEYATLYESIIAGTHQEVSEMDLMAKSTYTVLVRSSLLSMRETKSLLEWSNYVRTLDIAFESATEMYISVLESIRKEDSIMDIMVMLSRLADAHDAFDSGIYKLSLELAKAKIHGINMPPPNQATPETFYIELRRELMLAASTPSNADVASDLPTVEDRIDRVEDINTYCTKIQKAFNQRAPEHAKLNKQVVKLRKVALNKEIGKNDILKQDREIRDKVVMINRRFRKMILAMMRLREIPELYVKSMGQFIGSNGQLLAKKGSLLRGME